MSNTKSNRKTLQNQSYSHPLIKNLEQITQQTHSCIIPTYIPISSNNNERISCNIIRSTTLTPSNHSSFTLFVNPFSECVNELPLVNKLVECPVCRCAVNPHSKIQNYSRFQCNLCGLESEIPVVDSQISQQLNGYRVRGGNHTLNERINGKNSSIRRVCLAIEISEYLYERKIHNAISNCLSALRDGKFEVGIIFFDDSGISVLDQRSLTITKMVISSYHEFISEWNGLPISEEDFFLPVSEFNQSVIEIIQSIMYEGYFIKKTAIAEVLQLLRTCFNNQYQIKAFISTLNSNLNIETTENMNILTSIFKLNENKKQEKRKKSDQIQSINVNSFPSIHENMQFFIVNQNVTFQDSIKTLGYHIAHIYLSNQKNRTEENLYYDLYESLERKQQSSISFTIKSSAQLSLVDPKYPSYNLYGKISLNEARNEGRYRTYRLQMRNASTNNILPIKFNVNGSPQSQKLLIQISYNYTFQGQPQRVILNYSPKKILSDCEMGIESLDDQAYFNDHMRQALVGWGGDNFKDLRQRLQNQCEKFVRLLKTNYRYDSIHFPKTMKHYFLYVFSFLDKIKKGVLNSYQVYKWLISTLKIFSKQMYPRAFKIEDEILKNVKSSENITQKYQKLFIENGQQLYLVLGECDVDEIKHLFGYYDQISSISIGRYELPQIPSNSHQRKAIDLIRNHNPQSFLRLKIVDKQSQLYDQYIKPSLYNKAAHLQFLRRAWRNS